MFSEGFEKTAGIFDAVKNILPKADPVAARRAESVARRLKSVETGAAKRLFSGVSAPRKVQ